MTKRVLNATPYRTRSQQPSLNPSPVTHMVIHQLLLSLSLSSDHTWQPIGSDLSSMEAALTSRTLLQFWTIRVSFLLSLVNSKMVFCFEIVCFSAGGGWNSSLLVGNSQFIGRTWALNLQRWRWRLHLLSSSSASWLFPSSCGWSSCEPLSL